MSVRIITLGSAVNCGFCGEKIQHKGFAAFFDACVFSHGSCECSEGHSYERAFKEKKRNLNLFLLNMH